MNIFESLSKNAMTIQDLLNEQGLKIKVLELPSSTHTAIDAANSIGCAVAQIVKSLVFKTTKTNRPVLVLVSGANRVNENNINHLLGEVIKKADANYTREVTGFSIGGIPPIGHKEKIDCVYIDEDLLQFEILWAAAGTPNAVFSLNAQDLVTLTKGMIVSMK